MRGLRRRRFGHAGIRQSISTKFMGPTDSRGARIKATASGGKSVTVPYDYGDSTEEAHHKAARALAKKLGWTGTMVAGGGPKGTGNVYVFIDDDKINL